MGKKGLYKASLGEGILSDGAHSDRLNHLQLQRLQIAMSDTPIKPATMASEQPVTVSLAKFLEDVPPSQDVSVSSLVTKRTSPQGAIFYLNQPEIFLHCAHGLCGGNRIYRPSEREIWIDMEKANFKFIAYACSNCLRTTKVFAVQIVMDGNNSTAGKCLKFGEFPGYGAPTSPRMLRLFGKDRDVFLKGRRCENQGLGIGAFTYYRRVVESHRDDLLNEIIKAATKLGAPAEAINILIAARKEISFSKSIAQAKEAVPQSLLINGHNPLTLLHTALSVGVHELSDEQCLERAHDIRVVLSGLVERLGQALKDEATLNHAVGRLLNPK
jgi:hypothetical protein